jgi:hypothetical protein
VDLEAESGQDGASRSASRRDLYFGFGATIAALVASSIFSWLLHEDAKDANDINRAQAAVMEKTALRDNLTTATGLLAAENVMQRLNGLFILERIAVDSPAQSSTIRKLLTAFVRERAKAPEPLTYRPIVDVQEAVSILGRLVRPAERETIDLSYTYLAYQDLSNLNLPDANLDRAVFVETNMRNAKLVGARLHRAFFGRNAIVSGTDFSGAELDCAMFDGTDLSGAAGLTQDKLLGATLVNVKPPTGMSIKNNSPVACAK